MILKQKVQQRGPVKTARGDLNSHWQHIPWPHRGPHSAVTCEHHSMAIPILRGYAELALRGKWAGTEGPGVCCHATHSAQGARSSFGVPYCCTRCTTYAPVRHGIQQHKPVPVRSRRGGACLWLLAVEAVEKIAGSERAWLVLLPATAMHWDWHGASTGSTRECREPIGGCAPNQTDASVPSYGSSAVTGWLELSGSSLHLG